MSLSLAISFRAEIIENRRVASDIFKLTVKPLELFLEPLAGQFFMLQVGEGFDPLLRRPLSIYDTLESSLVFLYRIRGRGTTLLSQKKGGQIISLTGPFGKPYPEPDSREVLLVAGGLGIASLNYLIRRLSEKGYLLRLLVGARTRDEIILSDRLMPFVSELLIATDDGSEGVKGTVLDLLQEKGLTHDESKGKPVIYACGPGPLLRAVDAFAMRGGLRAYLSVEERMACGMGACLGCVIMTRDGYKRVCKEGPVFREGDILW